MPNPTQPMNEEELTKLISNVRDSGAIDDNNGGEDWLYSDSCIKQAVQSILADRNAAIREAQDEVINKAHTPCECGKGHYGAVVRSVQGGITAYCPFSKIVLQSQPNAKEEE